MKLTNKNSKYNLELNKFELDCLFLIAGNSSGRGKVAGFLSNIYDELADYIKLHENTDVYNYYNHLTDKSQLQAKVELYDNLKEESFDFVKKQDCSFYYPKAGRRDTPTFDIRYLEQRELKESYEKDGYLMGFDNGTLKKFKMDLVVNLVNKP